MYSVTVFLLVLRPVFGTILPGAINLMAVRQLDPQLYASPEWLELRETTIRRDGYSCRNCGSADRLEVHHWLPLPAHRQNVDSRGYAMRDNPLIVHDSGLITLCPECHETLTESRRRQAILKNPSVRKLARPEKQSDNIFELWALNGKALPFNVRKDTWSLKVLHFYRVEQIEITKWPYGRAWGRYLREGVVGELVKIQNSGTYTWRMSEEQPDDASQNALETISKY